MVNLTYMTDEIYTSGKQIVMLLCLATGVVISEFIAILIIGSMKIFELFNMTEVWGLRKEN